MHLSLQVPDDFCLDKWFETALPEDVALGLNAIPQLIQFVNSKNHDDHLQIKKRITNSRLRLLVSNPIKSILVKSTKVLLLQKRSFLDWSLSYR